MTQDTQFLERATVLVGHGYRIVPVKPGEKRVVVPSWQTLEATVGMAKKWAANGYANGNIGILTAHNPAIDLDIYDADMAEKMEAWCLAEFGAAAVRVGRAPKRLLLYCTDTPFPKQQITYADARGTKHKIEVLGDGQQFVAYGTHPDTKQPFKWTTVDEPLVLPADMMPTLDIDQARAVLAKFAQFAESAGWTFVGGGSRAGTSPGRHGAAVSDDDALLTFKPRLKLSKSEIEHALGYVGEADDYDRWIMVGMALHHQSQGHPAGLAMWHEWSSSAHNYDASAVDDRWESFNQAPTNHIAVTFASVLKIANAAEKNEKTEEFNRLLNVLRTSTDENEIFGPIAKQLATAVTSDFQLDIVAKKMQDRVFEITQVKPRIETVRKALAQASARGELVKKGTRPSWADGWVYLRTADFFFHVDTKRELSERGFNAVYDRELLSDEDRMLGAALPSSRAATMALNIYNMPTVDHIVYMPGMDKLIEVNGRVCANTFDETTVPPAKEAETPEEAKALAAVQHHFDVLFPDEIERGQVLDYLAYNVQFPAEKIVWGIVMQGAEGSGKTFISVMMSRVLGAPNVGPVGATELTDRFTGWAENRKMVFVEEIRLHGSNRYEILEKLKPYVSNEEVTIRKMNSNSYTIPNVANYIMFTNYWDALPLGQMDRRYYVVATWFQTKEQLEEWNQKHPQYFSTIFNAVSDHSDVIRHWLLTRVLSPRFQPKRPALDSAAKFKMRDQSEGNDESDVLSDTLEASQDPELSSKLLNADKLRAAMGATGALIPYGRGFNTMLAKAGFLYLGRFRPDPTAAPIRFYTKQPHLFPKQDELTVIREIQSSNLLAFDADPAATEEVDPFS